MAKIIEFIQLINLRKKTENDQQKWVLATGVFDLLHSEHKKFLKVAKAEGDVLVIGLETDERVKRIKGTNRPVWSLKKRLLKMSKIAVVDYVFCLPKEFDKISDHESLIAQIKPDILAVSKHTPHLANKRRLLKKYGGKLKIVLPCNPKISTSKLIERQNNFKKSP